MRVFRGEVDDAHPAAPQFPDDLVVGVVGQPRGQGVGRGRGGCRSASVELREGVGGGDGDRWESGPALASRRRPRKLSEVSSATRRRQSGQPSGARRPTRPRRRRAGPGRRRAGSGRSGAGRRGVHADRSPRRVGRSCSRPVNQSNYVSPRHSRGSGTVPTVAQSTQRKNSLDTRSDPTRAMDPCGRRPFAPKSWRFL